MAAILAFYLWRRDLRVKRTFKGNCRSVGVKSKLPESPRTESEVMPVAIHSRVFYSGWNLEARARPCPQLWPPPAIMGSKLSPA